MKKFKKNFLDFNILKWLGYGPKVIKFGKCLIYFQGCNIIIFSFLWTITWFIYLIFVFEKI